MLRFLLIALVLVCRSIPATADDDVPPMILARKPARITPTSDGYIASYDSGHSERWRRTSDGWVSDSARFTATSTGYSGGDERYMRSSIGWRCTTGNVSTMIYSNSLGYSCDDARFTRSTIGYTRSSPAPGNIIVATGSLRRTITRMKTSSPSSFRRWSDRSEPPVE